MIGLARATWGTVVLRRATVAALLWLPGCLPAVDGPCVGTLWYRDADGDGVGDAAASDIACEAPSGHVAVSGDCDDQDAGVAPGREERWYDGRDQDCDGNDADADGDGQSAASAGGEDCDDADAGIYAGAAERWYDGVDEDCSGGSDLDADADGADATAWGGADCDDADPLVGPEVEEICDDGVDNDCDGGAGACAPSGDWSMAAELAWTGSGRDDEVGAALLGPGDLSGDGLADLVIGAPGLDGDASLAGVVTVLTGPPPTSGPIADIGYALLGESLLDGAGAALGALDADGDGRQDLAIGAPYRTDTGVESGLVYLVSGPITADVQLATIETRLFAPGTGAHVGQAVLGAGDLDGDGAEDLVIGGPDRSDTETEGGAVWVVSGPIAGSTDLRDQPGRVTIGETGAALGQTLASAGDVDGDGLADLLVGAPRADAEEGAGQGLVLLLRGPVDGLVDAADAEVRIFGDTSGDHAGTAVAGAGDTDGDGLDDVLLGAPDASEGGASAGLAVLLLGPVGDGTQTCSASADARLLGASAGETAGSAVASAGDVDGDGHVDLLVGSPLASAELSYNGVVWLALSPLAGSMNLSAADVRVLGGESYDYAGAVLAGAGDIDADGHADILVGSPARSISGADNVGTAWLLYGFGM